MRFVWSKRFWLLVAAVTITAAILIAFKMASRDYDYCFDAYMKYTYQRKPLLQQITEAIENFSLTKLEFLMIGAVLSPLFLSIGLARWLATQLFCLALLLVPLFAALDEKAWHDCDRKGCLLCEFVGIWTLFVQLPVSVGILIIIAIFYLVEFVTKQRARSLA